MKTTGKQIALRIGLVAVVLAAAACEAGTGPGERLPTEIALIDPDYRIAVVTQAGREMVRITPEWNEQRVYPSPFGASALAWSPDGDQLAFSGAFDVLCGRIECPARHIFVLGLRTGAVRRLTPDSLDASSPAWSPDGRTIAFAGKPDNGRTAIHTVNPDGSGLRRLTDPDQSSFWPSWSPEGARIAFARNEGEGSGLYIINADGSGEERIETGLASARFPAWSPAGDRILVVGQPQLVSPRGLYTVRPGSGRAEAVPVDVSGVWTAAWAPDAKQIAFAAFPTSGAAIYVAGADGSQARRVADGQSPAWRPCPRFRCF